MNITNVLLLLH